MRNETKGDVRNSVIVRVEKYTWDQVKKDLGVSLLSSNISEFTDSAKFGTIYRFLAEGRSIVWIAKRLKVDIALGWQLWITREDEKPKRGIRILDQHESSIVWISIKMPDDAGTDINGMDIHGVWLFGAKQVYDMINSARKRAGAFHEI